MTAAIAIIGAALAGTTATAGATAPVHHKNAFKQVNLVSDLDMGPSVLRDTDVKNPWGIAFGPTTPLWVNNQASNKITLYSGANGTTKKVTKLGLVVTASSPFGIVFNPTKSFRITQNGVKAPAKFLFNEVTGTEQAPVAEVTGWQNGTTTLAKAMKPGSVQLGLALVPAKLRGYDRHGPFLLAADNVKGKIDVYNGRFKKLKARHLFVDPHSASDKLPPYNVTYLKGRVYVTYAAAGGPGAALSVFKSNGRFIKRLVNGAPLSGPWGMAIAPKHWGSFGGALLVGNVDDGKINAFNRYTGHFLGTLKDASGKPLVNLGLWGLAFGNGTIGTPRTLIFAAGIGAAPGSFNEFYEHGLIGLIKPIHRS
jgi:uncharacterized protein (TIGR03118 family)